MGVGVGPDDFFAERGYRLETEESDGFWWAHLVVADTGSVLVSRYGRGETESGARARAMRRWIVEQAT